MAYVVSAEIVPDNHQQPDGRTYVTNVFVDVSGERHDWAYLAAPDADVLSILENHRAQLEAILAARATGEN